MWVFLVSILVHVPGFIVHGNEVLSCQISVTQTASYIINLPHFKSVAYFRAACQLKSCLAGAHDP